MSRIGETANRPPQPDVFHGDVDPSRARQEVLRGLDGKQACPFCGSVSEKAQSPCARCGMDNTPDARKATKARIGPWYVLQARNPAAPGMRFETLLSFVRKGRVRARSVVRGPTTHQLWRFAAHVKGLSREFGLCFSCGSAIDPTANICPQCNRLQEPPMNPDMLLEDGPDESAGVAARPVYRELPEPADTSVAAGNAPDPAPEPEDADIVIPALGAFESDDVDPTFSEGPPVSPRPAAPRPPAAAQRAADPELPTPAFGGATPRQVSSPARQAQVPASPANPSPTIPSHNHPLSADASSENPFAIAPARRKGNGDMGFLSARELAAAFKLSFDPSADMDTVDVPDQMPDSAMPDGMRPGGILPRSSRADLARAPARPAKKPARSSGGLRRLALFMLILGVTGFAVLMWADPNFRQRTVQWVRSGVTRLHGYATGAANRPPRTTLPPISASADTLDVPMPPAREPRPDRTADPVPIAETPTPGVASPDTNAPAEAPTGEPPAAEHAIAKSPALTGVPADPPAGPVEKADATPPARESATEVDATPPAAPVVGNDVAPAVPLADQPAPQPAEQAPEAAESGDGGSDAESNFVRMRKLYKAALTAEGARPPDYAAAVKAYEAIQKLPEDAWPTDLRRRLDYARQQLK